MEDQQLIEAIRDIHSRIEAVVTLIAVSGLTLEQAKEARKRLGYPSSYEGAGITFGFAEHAIAEIARQRTAEGSRDTSA